MEKQSFTQKHLMLIPANPPPESDFAAVINTRPQDVANGDLRLRNHYVFKCRANDPSITERGLFCTKYRSSLECGLRSLKIKEHCK